MNKRNAFLCGWLAFGLLGVTLHTLCRAQTGGGLASGGAEAATTSTSDREWWERVRMKLLREQTKPQQQKNHVIARALLDVKNGVMSENAFFRTLADNKIEMMDVIEFKTLAYGQGLEVAEQILGPKNGCGSTPVEQKLLTYRRRVTMECIELALKNVWKNKGGPKHGYAAYVGYIGKWVNQEPHMLTFQGDIDFSFLSNDTEFSKALKAEFGRLIEIRTGLDPIAFDSVCTAHGKATPEVYVGSHGKMYGDQQFKGGSLLRILPPGNTIEVTGESGRKRMAGEVDLYTNMKFGELEAAQFRNRTEPALSLEMVRHLVNDIVRPGQPRRFDPLSCVVKASKYVKRSMDSIKAQAKADGIEIGIPADIQKLADLADALGELDKVKDIGGQIDKIKEFCDGKLPLDVQLEPVPGGYSKRAVAENNAFTADFFGKCVNAVWRNAQKSFGPQIGTLRTSIGEVLKQPNKKDGELNFEKFRKAEEIRARIVALEDMLKTSELILGRDKVRLDSDFVALRKNWDSLRDTFFAELPIEKICRHELKDWCFVTEHLAKSKNGKRLAAAMVIDLATKLNCGLDILDDTLLAELRGEPAFDGFYKLALTLGFKKDSWALQKVEWHQKLLKSAPIQFIQSINQSLNRDIQSSAGGRALTKGLLVFNLGQEMMAYGKAAMNGDWGGLACEIFRRRIPFGSVAESIVMEHYYTAAWGVVTTIFPPFAIPEAVGGITIMLLEGTRMFYWNEKLSLLEDNLYLTAKFKLNRSRTRELRIKGKAEVGAWWLVSVRYKDVTIPRESMYKEIIKQWENWDIFQETICSADPELSWIRETLKHPIMTDKLRRHQYGKLAKREEAVLKDFCGTLIEKLEERMAADYELVAGRLVDLIEELRDIARDLRIEKEMETAMVADAQRSRMADLMTWLWNIEARDFCAQGSQEERGQRIARIVVRYLKAYRMVLRYRQKAEGAVELSGKQDDGLRLLTGPNVLSGNSVTDLRVARHWLSVQNGIMSDMACRLLAIKRKYIAGAALDSAFDKRMLREVVRHEVWRVAWREVYKNREAMKPKALERAGKHDTERKTFEEDFERYYARQGVRLLTVRLRQRIDGRDTDTPVPKGQVYVRYRTGKKVKLDEKEAGDYACAPPPPGEYHLFAWADGFKAPAGQEKVAVPFSIPAPVQGETPEPVTKTVYLSPVNDGRVVVIVMDRQSMMPVPGAKVVLATSESGAGPSERQPAEIQWGKGRHIFEQLPPGTYRVSVSAPNYKSRVRDAPVVLTAEASAPPPIRLLLDRLAGVVVVAVTDENGARVADAEVSVGGAAAVTDSAGQARFANVPAGRCVAVRVSKTGYHAETTEVDVLLEQENAEIVKRVVLRRAEMPATLVVAVTCTGSAPAAGQIRIRVQGPATDFSGTGRHARIENVGPGTYTVSASAPGFPEVVQRVDIAPPRPGEAPDARTYSVTLALSAVSMTLTPAHIRAGIFQGCIWRIAFSTPPSNAHLRWSENGKDMGVLLADHLYRQYGKAGTYRVGAVLIDNASGARLASAEAMATITKKPEPESEPEPEPQPRQEPDQAPEPKPTGPRVYRGKATLVQTIKLEWGQRASRSCTTVEDMTIEFLPNGAIRGSIHYGKCVTFTGTDWEDGSMRILTVEPNSFDALFGGAYDAAGRCRFSGSWPVAPRKWNLSAKQITDVWEVTSDPIRINLDTGRGKRAVFYRQIRKASFTLHRVE